MSTTQVTIDDKYILNISSTQTTSNVVHLEIEIVSGDDANFKHIPKFMLGLSKGKVNDENLQLEYRSDETNGWELIPSKSTGTPLWAKVAYYVTDFLTLGAVGTTNDYISKLNNWMRRLNTQGFSSLDNDIFSQVIDVPIKNIPPELYTIIMIKCIKGIRLSMDVSSDELPEVEVLYEVSPAEVGGIPTGSDLYRLAFTQDLRYKKGLGYHKRLIGQGYFTPVVKLVDSETQDDYSNMVFVKGGTFQMGTNNGYDHEKPVHIVTVNYFYIGKYEVTQKEWKEVMGNNPSYFKGDDIPVEQVSWYDVVDFCNKKSDKEGLTRCYSGSGKNTQCNFNANGYRLPTEAEWEYAARGGNKSNGYKYSGSNNCGDVAWYWGNSVSKTHPVGQKKTNELGIYDMSGNVWEWCWDWHDGNYYSNSPQNNPKGPGSGRYRVSRGGCWASTSTGYGCRVASRSYINPGISGGDGGFRFSRTP